MRPLDNLSGQSFGIYEVLSFDHMAWNGINHKHPMSYYKCRCKKCGSTFIRARSHLIQCKNIRHGGGCKEVS